MTDIIKEELDDVVFPYTKEEEIDLSLFNNMFKSYLLTNFNVKEFTHRHGYNIFTHAYGCNGEENLSQLINMFFTKLKKMYKDDELVVRKFPEIVCYDNNRYIIRARLGMIE